VNHRLNFLVLALLLVPVQCWAWGAEGHRVIAAIAADELTPAARTQVEQLLGMDASVGMMEASTWADEIRLKRPDTARWHFADIPVEATNYDARRDCRNGDCVVAQIEKDARIVGDRQLVPPVRAEALRFLIHFVGDLHQPLHAADNGDRGGNQVHVLLRRRRTNIHAVWDVDVVRALGRSPEEISVRLEYEMTPQQQREWSLGTPEGWIMESHRLARMEIYSRITGQGGTDGQIVLPTDYARQEAPFAAQQLEKASVRLAAVLNAVLR
jgi:hypothetical protein